MPRRPHLDIVRQAVAAVSLTVIGGVIGVNAAALPSDWQTGGLIAFTVCFLAIQYSNMEFLIESVENGQRRRTYLLMLTSLGFGVFTAYILDGLVNHAAISYGIMLGWWLAFMVLSNGEILDTLLGNKSEAAEPHLQKESCDD